MFAYTLTFVSSFCAIILLLLLPSVAASYDDDTAYKTVHGKYVSIDVGSKECNVLDYGAKGDGKTDDSGAIQAAIDDCSKDDEGGTIIVGNSKSTSNGGGIIGDDSSIKSYIYLLKNGLYINGSNVEFTIEEGATLTVHDDVKSWPENVHILTIQNVQNIVLSGKGTLDGRGENWWRACEKDKDIWRPHTVQTNEVQHLLVKDMSFINGPNHVLELYADNTELDSVRVINPPSPKSHNTDAVDIHGQPFYVHDVYFDTGDDNIAAHANHTLVENSYFGAGHGASIGSLCDNYLTNITFRNITFKGTTAGARIKSHPNCSGHIWNIEYNDLRMTDVESPIEVTQYYDGTGHSTFLFEDVRFEKIKVERSQQTKYNFLHDDYSVNFDCDDHYDGKANCQNFLLKDYKQDKDLPGMNCQGVYGEASDLEGLDSCLKSE